MPHGGPDWGTEGPVSTIYSIQDLGELAARLGSIVTHDRRGNVIWLDDFEDGLSQWELAGAGAYSINWNSQYARNGGFSCQLVTAPSDAFQASITRYTAYPILSPIGIEFSFSYEQNWRYLILDHRIGTPTAMLWGTIRYNHITNIFQQQTGPLAWTDIPDTEFTAQGLPEAFDTIKLVINFITRKFMRLIINSKEVDVSALDCYITAPPVRPMLSSSIILETDSNAKAKGYIDDVIITQNEP